MRKLIKCEQCIYYESDKTYKNEGVCKLDNSYTREHRVCDKKAIRKTKKQFIAVSCHFDIIDWLLPDWVFNTDSMTFQLLEGQKKNRPDIKFEIFNTKDKTIWKMFAKHHYLSHSHNNAAECYLAIINDEIVGFISVLHFPHATSKNIKKVHRLVVLPDYQGLGIGLRILDEIGYIYKKNKFRFTIVSSSPSLIASLSKSKKCAAVRIGRTKESNGIMKQTTSKNRISASFELK